MSANGLEVFDTTLQKTNTWLNEVMETLGCRDRHAAYLALRATLHALRDRLNVDEVAHLGAQLPMLVRGFYYEGWDPSPKRLKERRAEQFLARIRREMRGNERLEPEPERVAQAVLTVLSLRVSEGEIADIKHILPEEVRALWP